MINFDCSTPSVANDSVCMQPSVTGINAEPTSPFKVKGVLKLSKKETQGARHNRNMIIGGRKKSTQERQRKVIEDSKETFSIINSNKESNHSSLPMKEYDES